MRKEGEGKVRELRSERVGETVWCEEKEKGRGEWGEGRREMQGDDWKLMNMISELVELTVMV